MQDISRKVIYTPGGTKRKGIVLKQVLFTSYKYYAIETDFY